MPKVSVLMPVYQTDEAYLRQAIQSILNQTFSDFELLILDDCPSNSREQIVRSFTDLRIRYQKNPKNLGISATRNRLLDLAKGDYFAVMDHDDIAMPTRLACQVRVLDNNPDIGVVGCWIEQFPKFKIVCWPESHMAIESYLMQGCAIPHTGAMIRKSALQGARYDAAFSPAEDYHLWCQLLGKTHFYNIPQVLMRYRWYGGNTSKKQARKMYQASVCTQHWVHTRHPDIWVRTRDQATYIVRFKLFGLIPLGRMHQVGQHRPHWLRLMPFITTKAKLEVLV